MKKYPGLSAAMRHTLRHLPAFLLGVAAVAAPGAASARRPDHTTHARRSEAPERPDFSRTSSAAKSQRKHAHNAGSSSSARGNEHKAHEGQGNSRPSAKSPHQGSPRRKHQIQPDDDYEPITMKRVRNERNAPSKATERHHLAEREPAPMTRGAADRARERSERVAIAAAEVREPRETPRRVEAKPAPEPEHATLAASHPLSTNDFLRAAHGESNPEANPTEHVPERTALRLLHSGAPYASGVAHPSDAPVTITAAPSAPSYIDERQVAEAQRVAIGVALRPSVSPAASSQAITAAATQQSQPRVAASSLPAAPPTGVALLPEPRIATYPQQAAITTASVSAPPSERSYIAARTIADLDAARAPEDVVRATALGPLTHQEMASAAVAPSLPGLYSRDGHMIMPAPLKGSHEVLLHQNEMADAAGLTRIRNDRDLDQLREQHRLVDFPESDGLRVNPELPERRRCARPWTVAFAAQMARAYYNEFHEPFTISSAVRTMAFQARLQRVNGNAAATRGEAASPHLTGQAFDIGKTGLTRDEIAWLRNYLAPIIDSGKIDVEEEFQQACFHISVYPGATAHRRTQLAEMR